MGNAGRVLMIPKGEYNSATTYERLDFVYYQGRSYVCKQTSTGNAPTNTTYWQALTGDASAEIQALTNYDANTGVKNLFDNTATTGTQNGVTFTVKTDKSVEAVGTLTSNYSVKFLGTFHGEAGKQYLVTGGISSLKYLEVYNTSVGIDVKDTGNGVTFTPQSDTDFDVAAIVLGNGSTFNDTFYPMIRLASITDPTYQPYAKTNVELTQALGGFEFAIYEGTAPADTTNYKTENIQTILGFEPSYFIILAAERYNNANSIWYQMSNDMTANDYVIRAASDNGVDFRVKFSDVTNYTKYRAVILYKR